MFSQFPETTHAPILVPQSHQQSGVPPINRLPSEIIEYIFSLSADEDTLSQYRNQLYLSWVCQAWRRVIINNALLWTTIDFRGNPELVGTVIQRSGNAELLVELWDETFDYPEKLALLSSTLISEAYRIETIQAILSSSSLQLIVDDVLRHSFPSLRHLAFCGILHDQIPLIDSQMPFTLDISNLETFEIYDSSQVPWDCLRSVISKVWKLDIRFEWQETFLDFFADIQSSFNQLKVLVMRFESTCDIPQLYTITLPNITTLVIEAGCLRIPNVRRLAIYDEMGFNFSFHPDFDYNSIEYVSVTNCWSTSFTFCWSTSFTFHIVGSTEKDMTPTDNWEREEVKQFNLKAHFNQESAGFHDSLRVLNDLLPRMPRVREISLPHRFPEHLPPVMETSRSPSNLITHYESLASLSLIRSTPDAYVFGR
ncbi:hypothetical protein Clacol_007782 [Clathrus columnatus]|uniref:F-box domain-containing protein n=1 Tax=Clathrus columnatus TaxID=1419009 RepID=A0AAV5ALG4_9AGAM|nr:hypothetical protein Clacol_007782 [Clathrus columnatus]